MKNVWKKLDEYLFFVKYLFLFSAVLLQSCELPNTEKIRKNQYLPEKNFIPDISLGQSKFKLYCIQCHGIAAQGSNKGPPLVDEIYQPDHHADQAFRWAVRDGVSQHHWRFGNMPPIKNVTPEDVAHIIVYVRQLQRQEDL